MRKLEPGTTHPFLWVLTDVFGLSIADVATLSGLTRPVLKRLEEQRPVTPSQLLKLQRLIERTAYVDYPRTLSPPPRFSTEKPPPEFRHFYLDPAFHTYRKATWALVQFVLATYKAADPVRPPRETNLSSQLLATLGSEGAPRSRIIAQLKSEHRAPTVRRCAARIGVRETVRSGKTWWSPPQDIAMLPSSTLPKPKPIIRTSPRAAKIQQTLELYLVKRPDGARATDAIQHVRDKTGCTRAAVFRAARDLRLHRDTVGFGPGKYTTWVYQAALDALHVKPPEPAHAPGHE